MLCSLLFRRHVFTLIFISYLILVLCVLSGVLIQIFAFYNRNKDFQEVVLEKDGEVLLRFAAAYGFRNIQNLVQKLKRGKSPYHFIEVMACPSGESNMTSFVSLTCPLCVVISAPWGKIRTKYEDIFCF